MKDRDLLPLLEEYSKIAVLTHVRPDGDAIGSSLAWGRALMLAGKKVELYCPDVIPLRYSFLPAYGSFRDQFLPLEDEKLLAFVLDCSDLSRLEYMKDEMSRADKIINIDHHTTNEGYGDYNIIDTSAAATAEIIFRLIQENNLELDQEISLYLYVAISSDTGSFRYNNTTPRTMEIAGRLLEKGVSPSLVSEKLFDELSLSTVLLLQEALSTLNVDKEHQVAWMSMKESTVKKYEASPAELEGFVNYARNIKNIDVGVFFYHENGETKVGLRSRTIDVARLASYFGGGGHPRAAGCTVKGRATQVEKKVLNSIKAAYKEKAAQG